jgi:hypothetical protein
MPVWTSSEYRREARCAWGRQFSSPARPRAEEAAAGEVEAFEVLLEVVAMDGG